MTRKLPSSVPFAALLTYSPRGTSETSSKSRDACYALKNGREVTVRSAVARLVQLSQGTPLADFFGTDVTLIPMPRSAPLVAGALWPADVLCREMVKQGLAGSVETSLARRTAVSKSAFAKPGERPDVQKHLETIVANPFVARGAKITVIDDVITKGVTLYAGCVLVQEVVPGAEVRAFGMVRTMGLIPEVEAIIAPVVGTLIYSYGDVRREP